MSWLREFVNAYGLQIAMAIFTAIAGFLGTQLKRIVQKYVDDKTKADVVRTVVKAMRQVYKDADGSTKYQMAVENITEMLNSKNISITQLEIDMLIEAAVDDFNLHFTGTEITAEVGETV